MVCVRVRVCGYVLVDDGVAVSHPVDECPPHPTPRGVSRGVPEGGGARGVAQQRGTHPTTRVGTPRTHHTEHTGVDELMVMVIVLI